MSEIPDKLFYKVGEVCKYTDTQPYVLRFWESEFPQLTRTKNRGGQRAYSREDVDLILKIKKLLYEQEYTIAGVREFLQHEENASPARSGRAVGAQRETGWEDLAGPAPAISDSGREHSGVPRARTEHTDSYKASYEAAREEIESLRRQLAETEEKMRQAEDARESARERAEKVAARLESVLASLEPRDKGRRSS